MQIAFATHTGLGELTVSDRLAAEELHRRGGSVVPIPWSSPEDWRRFDAVVIRATWDYYTRPEEFRRWLRALEDQRVSLWNPAPLALWNLHKGYLRDLEHAGVPVVPTAWVSELGPEGSLAQLARARGWTDVVIKPAISANAHQTWRTSGQLQDDDERRFRTLVDMGEVMVQPVIDSLLQEGELSFVFLGGAFSHAVLKRPASGDFRVQSSLGGTVARVDAPEEWVDQARAVVDAVRGPWLYARVDGCIVDRRLVLMELEMLEPDLFLNLEAQAPGRFADALLRLLEQ